MASEKESFRMNEKRPRLHEPILTRLPYEPIVAQLFQESRERQRIRALVSRFPKRSKRGYEFLSIHERCGDPS